jgi:hypothetical protein
VNFAGHHVAEQLHHMINALLISYLAALDHR